MTVSMLTSPLEICHLKFVNFLAGRSMAWIYSYSFLTLKAKKYIFIYENWLIVAIIYHNSQVGNRKGLFVSGGRGDGIWCRKTTKT